MSEAHAGQVLLKHTFREAYEWLTRSGPVNLSTEKRATAFQAMAGFASRGPHAGERVIRFTSKGRESARAYACCWGRYHNCYATRIGMYCVAVDSAVDWDGPTS